MGPRPLRTWHVAEKLTVAALYERRVSQVIEFRRSQTAATAAVSLRKEFFSDLLGPVANGKIQCHSCPGCELVQMLCF